MRTMTQNRTRTGAILLAFVILTGTHWYANHLGRLNQRTRNNTFFTDETNRSCLDNLRLHIEALRIFARHADALTPDELASWCQMTEVYAKGVERPITNYRTPPDPKTEEESAELVAEARRLIADVKRDDR